MEIPALESGAAIASRPPAVGAAPVVLGIGEDGGPLTADATEGIGVIAAWPIARSILLAVAVQVCHRDRGAAPFPDPPDDPAAWRAEIRLGAGAVVALEWADRGARLVRPVGCLISVADGRCELRRFGVPPIPMRPDLVGRATARRWAAARG